jgi:hypothetical protein
MEEFFDAYRGTGHLVMMLQEEIIFEEYFRCYCLGGKDVRIMEYEPRNPHHLRYAASKGPASTALIKEVHNHVLALNQALGYDFNTVEMAVRDGVPYAIDFCNPAPDADVKSVGQENFEWVVEHAARMAVERARSLKPGGDNLTWGKFVTNSAVAFLKGSQAEPKAPKPNSEKKVTPKSRKK